MSPRCGTVRRDPEVWEPREYQISVGRVRGRREGKRREEKRREEEEEEEDLDLVYVLCGERTEEEE